MKTVFLLLCLANAVYVLWQFHLGRFNTPPPSPKPVKQQLFLLSEIEPKSARKPEIELPTIELPDVLPLKTFDEIKDAPVSVIKLAAEQNTPQCYEVGPFADHAALQQWLSRHKIAPAAAKILDKKPEASSFLVYYPAGKTPEQNRLNKQMLIDKGISDFWSIPNGELQGAISLGLFTTKPRAEFLKNQLGKQGVHAAIQPRYNGKSGLFVQIHTGAKKPNNAVPAWTRCQS